MAEKKFMIKGTICFGGKISTFLKKVTAAKKESAIVKLKSTFGSNYKIKKQNIKVESAEEVD